MYESGGNRFFPFSVFHLFIYLLLNRIWVCFLFLSPMTVFIHSSFTSISMLLLNLSYDLHLFTFYSYLNVLSLSFFLFFKNFYLYVASFFLSFFPYDRRQLNLFRKPRCPEYARHFGLGKRVRNNEVV